MKYLLIHLLDESELSEPADAGHDSAGDREVDAWVSEVEAAGIKLYGGRLRPAAEAVTLRIRGGEMLRTDGPFAETKEQIAGFDVLECDSLAEAIEVAGRHPTARFGTFELRQFWE